MRFANLLIALALILAIAGTMSYAQMTTTGIGKSGGGGGGGCNGTIDLSTGCAAPMLGGL